jgi:hypothetical protein
MASLSIAIPAFSKHLLEAGIGDQDSLLLVVLCDAIVQFFKKPSDSGEVWHLAESILGLFEGLATHAKDDCVLKYA